LGNKTALISLVGDDAAGRYIMDFCAENNIDTSGVCVDASIDTSINIGLVREDGERTFLSSRSGSQWKMSLEHVDFEMFPGAKLLTLASIFNNPLLDNDTLVKIFRAAKEHGLIICADMIKNRFGEKLADIREALPYLDYFFPNYEEASALTGIAEIESIADALLGCGVKNVVIKNGRQGCFIKTGSEAITVPAYLGAVVADAIGAGDNFVAGFITAILEGTELATCAQYANVVASISVESMGATSGVKSRGQVDERYTRQKEGAL